MSDRASSLSLILRSPVRILAVVLLLIFTAEVAVMFLLPRIVPPGLGAAPTALLDAMLLTVACAPALWWVIIGPLRKIAIQEHQRSETIVENAGEGILTLDRELRIVSCNRAGAELLGAAGTPESGGAAGGLVGRPLRELVPQFPDVLDSLPAELELEAVRLDGERFPIHLAVSQWTSESGRLWIAVLRDLTESQRAEADRIAMARQTEALRAQQMATLAQLATGVAHEIRNPLTSIKMLIQVNRDRLADEGLPTGDLELVEHEIRRMEKSVTGLLDYARPEAAELEPFAIQETVRRAVRLIEGRCQSQGVRLEVEAPEAPAVVRGDRSQLQQLLLNLSLNSLDAMPQGGELSLRVTADAEQVEVVVADTGEGIQPSVLSQLFAPFVTTKPDGVGLGLGICRRIAETHHGSLAGMNRPGRGAQFKLRLPLADAPPANDTSGAARHPGARIGSRWRRWVRRGRPGHGDEVMQRLLVIDDEPSILRAFERAFDGEQSFGGVRTTVLTTTTAAEGERLFVEHSPDVVVLDLRLPDASGLECFQRLRAHDPRVPVIFITGHGTVEAAIEATKLGAYDYLFKPLELDEIRELLEKAFRLSRMVRVQPVLADEQEVGEQDAIVGRCRAMKEVYQAIGRVAAQNLTVLLQGESGTGKEVVAQAIYHHSARSDGPFRAINCAAIPDTLLESEIFGHEKGAFTDAHRQRTGKLEQADQGTLFLDEVGDMSPMTQAKLLRVLQEQTFERVGGDTPIKVDTRIIAATNHDLKQLVSEGLFRADLYFRLSVVTIQLPPLREREGDLRILAEYFIRKYSKEFGKQVRMLAPETLERLEQYHWPGNVRELESVVKQSLLSARGNVLLPEFLPPLSPSPEADAGGSSEFLSPAFVAERLEAGSDNVYAEAISVAERQLLRQVLEHTSGNQLKAAGILGISRVTLRSKLKSLGIDPSDFA